MCVISQRLSEVRENRQLDYNYPFMWVHGEDDETILTEIQKIYDSGIRGLCVESRPHEGFCREEWWSDMDLILSRCQELGMQVWLLDDKHFPTGVANGVLNKDFPHLRKRGIYQFHTDVRGPITDGAAILPELPPDGELVCVTAFRRVDRNDKQELTDECMDLTDRVRDGLVWFDLGPGVYRIYTVYSKIVNDHHIDTLSSESVDVLLNEVYESHYDHYKQYFGNVFQGFFSDEPYIQARSFLGMRGEEAEPGTGFPWNENVHVRMSQILGEDCRKYLPAIWIHAEGLSPRIRSAYMEAVTQLYYEHFNKRLSDWCHAHGVRYIGHIIEDANRHSSFTAGGHFFRSLEGMDMAGIDVVLCQIVPGMQDHVIHIPVNYHVADPNFFSFGLAKLASSHAHIQPAKQGLAMCEMFGAYGWSEGLRMMKWLVDHMIVRGINRFVPHAFTLKENDPDCPPHFYANGTNPQYPWFRLLMEYADRQIHLTTAGSHVCGSALLYHAEAEWSGGQYTYFHHPARLLTEAQLEFDIVPCDYLQTAQVEAGQLVVGDCRFHSLIIPMSEYLPRAALERLEQLSQQGLTILWLDQKTEKDTDCRPFSCNFATVIPMDAMTDYIRRNIGWDIRTGTPFRSLRYSHRKDGEADLYMLFNEDVEAILDTDIAFSADHGPAFLYDPYTNKLTRFTDRRIRLEPYETRFVIFGAEGLEAEEPEKPCQALSCPSLRWDIRGEEIAYTDSDLFCIGTRHPRFGGELLYRTTFEGSDIRTIDLGAVGDAAEVFVNGESLGVRIAPPYRFTITAPLKAVNTLEVKVITNLGYARRDKFSSYMLLEPNGLLGPVKFAHK